MHPLKYDRFGVPVAYRYEVAPSISIFRMPITKCIIDST